MLRTLDAPESYHLHVALAALRQFMAQQDELSDEDSDKLEAWLKYEKELALFESERVFLQAAAEFVLALPQELSEKAPGL